MLEILSKKDKHIAHLEIINEQLTEDKTPKESEQQNVLAALERAKASKSNIAKSALEEIRDDGDPAKLITFLQEECKKPHAELIELNREIAAVSFLIGDITSTQKALETILALEPEDLDAINRMGWIHQTQGRNDEAGEAYTKILVMSEEDSLGQAIAYSNLGNLLQEYEDLNKAECCQLKSLEINRKLEREEGIATDYLSLGNIHFHGKNFVDEERLYKACLAKSERYYKRSLRLSKSIPDMHGIAQSYSSLANVYLKRKDFSRAEKYYNKSLELHIASKYKASIAIVLSNLGMMYEEWGKLGKAKECWEQSLKLFIDLGAVPKIAQVKKYLDEIEMNV